MADDGLPGVDRLAEVTRAAGRLELEPLLQTVIEAAEELTRSEAAAILEFDERSRSLRYLAAPPDRPQAHQLAPVPLDQSAVAPVIRKCAPLRIPGDPVDPALLTRPDLILTSTTRSLLAVPLLAAGRVLGVLEAVNKNGADYTEEDATILETLGALAAIAMDRSALKHRVDASLAELSELDRLKSDFIAITSHELRTPLGVILGHATYLRELLPQEYRDQLEVIIKNAARLKEIVESVASMDNYRSGRSRVHQQPVSIGKVIAEVADSFAPLAAGRSITLEAPAPPQDILVEADHTKISIALGNLVKNALTFTNEGGLVRIQTESMPGYVKVSVIDNGIGIPRQDLPRVFERFFQVERHLTRRHNGMGLGLSVAKVMVEMHGGRIWAESVEGQGSTFSFLLPVQAVEVQPAMF